MTEINYEKKYKKLEKAVKKFLGGYIWANCDMAEDQGYGIVTWMTMTNLNTLGKLTKSMKS